MAKSARAGSAYRGAESYDCNVWVYGSSLDPICEDPAEDILLSGIPLHSRPVAAELGSSVLAAEVHTTISGPGTWAVTCKVPRSVEARFAYLWPEDAWVDIEFVVNGKRWHATRGLLESVHRHVVVNHNGAMLTVWTLKGSCLGSVFSKTRVQFNHYSAENIGGGALLRSSLVQESFFGNGGPDDVTKGYLFGFLDTLGKYGRASWAAPAGVPNVSRGKKAIDWMNYYADSSSNVPARVAVNPNWVNVEGSSIWELAQQWCDPEFNELFVDLVDSSGKPLDPKSGPQTREDTKFGVILRQRPFPHSHNQQLNESAWESLPTATIYQTDIASGLEESRGGAAGVNWVEVSPQILQENLGANLQAQAPMVDVRSVEIHGVRRQLVTSQYVSDPKGDASQYIPALRQRFVQWHCLNQYYFNGTIPLGVGRPDIRVGQKLTLEPDGAQQLRQTWYTEAVTHRFSATEQAAKLRTTVVGTRGWIGEEDSHQEALRKAYKRFRVLAAAAPGVEFQDPIERIA